MKIETKYNNGDEVYVLTSKRIIKTNIYKIKIEINSSTILHENGEIIESNTPIVKYLVQVERKKLNPHIEDGGYMSSYDWFDGDDIALTKDDLIAKMI